MRRYYLFTAVLVLVIGSSTVLLFGSLDRRVDDVDRKTKVIERVQGEQGEHLRTIERTVRQVLPTVHHTAPAPTAPPPKAPKPPKAPPPKPPKPPKAPKVPDATDDRCDDEKYRRENRKECRERDEAILGLVGVPEQLKGPQ